jgi:hypothetical protein
MALGGCFAVSAVGLAQQQPQVQPPQPAPVQYVHPVQYLSPFSVAQQPAPPPMSNRTPLRPVQQMQPPTPVNGPIVAAPVQPVGNNQGFIPVQPVQSYVMTQNGPIIAQQLPAAASPAVAPPQPVVNGQPVLINNQPTSSEAVMMSAPVTNGAATPNGVPYTTQYVMAPQRTTSATPVAGQTGAAASTNAPANMTTAPVTTMNGASCNQCTGGCDACQQTKCCQPCGPEGRVWVSAEYLLWWASGMSVPALVTASPNGTPRSAAGVLGDPRTRILYGDSDINDGIRGGFRLRFGAWFDNCQTCGIDGGYFFLGEQTDRYRADCTDAMVLTRPIFNVSPNVTTGNPVADSELVCFPGIVNGSLSVDSTTDFTGFDVNFRKNFSCDCCNRIDWLVGFRYLKLDDTLTISEDLTVEGTNQALPVGTRIQLSDSFVTRNEFYGPQFGMTGEHRRSGGWYVSWRFLLGLGTTHKEATIAGSTTITQPGAAPVTYPGGLLALPTNMGRYTKNDFAVVPELNLNLGYQFTPNLRVFAGYSFLYWSNVTRPGDIIDLTVNTTQLPPGQLVGPARPTFTWNDSDFWAQGINFGVELRY